VRAELEHFTRPDPLGGKPAPVVGTFSVPGLSG
jgi:hypothetical protein